QVRVIAGDSDVATYGGGSHSGRSMRLAGVVMSKATTQVIERGRRLAAALHGQGDGSRCRALRDRGARAAGRGLPGGEQRAVVSLRLRGVRGRGGRRD